MQPPSGLQLPQDASSLAAGLDIVTTTINSAATAAIASIASAAATATQTSAATAASMASSNDGDDSQGECRLLGPFALFVQLALGGLALLSLVSKRWRERPQRPLKIWFFDVSKQVFGSVLVHIANAFMSMLTSGRFDIQVESPATKMLMMRRSDNGSYTPNPCSFYLLNLAIDTTLGIPILIILLRATTGLASYTRFGQPPESIQSGHYGSPPSAWWWLKQSLIYFIGLFGMKICVLIIFLMIPDIAKVGDWALRWTEGNERLQIAFSMMIFPLIMNALQYYIIDSFIKEKDTSSHEALASDESDDDDENDRLYDDAAELGSGSQRRGDSDNSRTKSHRRGANTTADEEYDPAVDGSSPPATAGSSLTRHYPGSKAAPPELFPKE